MTKSDRIKLYTDFLKGVGYVPEVVADNDIRFKVEGGVYHILIDDEQEYFSLLYPRFWPIRDESQREKIDAAALDTTADTKVGKVIASKDNVTATVELYLSPPDAVKAVFNRSLKALKYAVKMFKEKMAA